MTCTPDDTAPEWRAFRVLLRGENGWYQDGTLNLRPHESLNLERCRIEAYEHCACRLVPAPAV